MTAEIGLLGDEDLDAAIAALEYDDAQVRAWSARIESAADAWRRAIAHLGG